MIRGAAAGSDTDRVGFAQRYEPVIRSYLAARWRGAAHRQDLDDAVQEVFVECYRQGGVLERASSDRPGGFRAFLYGVLRNVALRAESKQARRREHQPPSQVGQDLEPADEDRCSQVFDRAWARAVMKEAASKQAAWAADLGQEALHRVELLRLRFQEGLPIREIAERWNADPVHVHREYARARKEFRRALLEVMTFHHPEAADDAEQECARLLALLA